MFSHKAGIFFDRDGTLIEDCNYLSDPAKICLLPGVKTALKQLKKRPCLFFLFTNQSGIGRGFFTYEVVERCHQRMLELLEETSDFFTQICIAPGTPDNPDPYRKPSPKFILECLAKYQLNPDKCWMIGDKPSDIQAGVNAHIHTLFLGKTKTACEATAYCENFYEVLDVLKTSIQG